MIDDTAFGSAKNGVLLTEKKIYEHSLGRSGNSLELWRIKSVNLIIGFTNKLFINKTEFHEFSTPGKDALQHFAKLLGELSKISLSKDVESLIASLKDENSDVRKSAATSLANISDPITVEALIASLKDKVSVVRKFAAIALGNIRDPRAVEPLVESLNDKKKSVRQHSAEALGKIKDARSVEPLITTMKDKDSDVQKEAFRALGNIKDTRAVKPLIAILKGMDNGARKCASSALAILGKPAVESLVKALKNENMSVREQAAETLGEIKDNRSIEPLIQALKDKYDLVRGSAANALGEIKDNKSIEPLIQALKDKDHWVRESAANALDKMGWKPKNNKEKAQYLIAKEQWDELVRFGTPAIEPLIHALKEDNIFHDIRGSVAEVLGEIKDERSIEPLIQALKVKDESGVGESAANALDKMGWKPKNDEEKAQYLLAKERWDELVILGTPAVKTLIQAQHDRDEEIQLKAVKSIIKIGKPAVEPLIQSLKSDLPLESISEEDVRGITSLTLEQMGEIAVEALIQALKNESNEAQFRAEVAQILGNIGDSRALEPLTFAIFDTNQIVHEKANLSFRMITNKFYDKWSALPEVKKLLHEGPKDKVGSKVFKWLKANEGRKVKIEFETTEGENFSESATWIITPPKVPTDDYALVWEIPELDEKLELQINTAQKVRIKEGEMVFSKGYNRYWIQSIDMEGISTASAYELEPDIWQTLKFRLRNS